MKAILIVVGKTKIPFIKEGFDFYLERIRHYLNMEVVIINDIKNSKNLSSEQLKEIEGNQILISIQNGDYVVLLDEKGKELSSVDFSGFLQGKMNSGIKKIIFITGGAYGFSEKLYQRANDKISLSKMTLTHEMVRMIFAEQLYRAMTIIRGEGYHH
jgi:23S rRNA (pseudouridine1915-N3)-methyltransferase